MNLKKMLIGLTVMGIVAIYPLSSVGKSDNNKIVLTKNNTVVLNEEVTEQSVADVTQQLMKLDSSYFNRNKPIYLFLYTPGGDIDAGLELIEVARGLHRKVDTISLFSASMGFQIVENLDTRYVLKDAILMSHRAEGSFEGYFGGKAPSQLDSRYAVWLERLQELDEQVVKRTNGKQTLESYRNQYQDEMWLTGQQAVEQGYADEVVTVSCSSSLDGLTSHQVEFMGYLVSYDTANCPLISGLLNIKVASPDSRTFPISNLIVQEIKNKFLDQHDLNKNIK